METGQLIAVVLSPDSLRRLAAGLGRFKRPDVNYWVVDYRRPVANILALVRKWRVSGVITEAIEVPRLTGGLCSLGLPAVIGPADAPRPGVACVAVDDPAVGSMAAEHFMTLGLQHFAYLGEPHRLFSRLRHQGYRDALRRVGFECHTFDLLRDAQNPKRALEYWDLTGVGLREWIRLLPRPVGLFTAHDPLGRMATAACMQQGIRVPDDVAILGVDNDDIVCALSQVPLSSVKVPWEHIGSEMARLCDAMVCGARPPRRTVLFRPTGIAQRQSTNIETISDPVVSKALQFIRNNIHRPLDVQDVVRAVVVSRRDLERRFRRVLRRTPRDQIVRHRVELVKKLLAETDMQMPEIAARVGLQYPERLTVVFRKDTGVPPSAYRRGLRGG